jgi:hypothetical protein
LEQAVQYGSTIDLKFRQFDTGDLLTARLRRSSFAKK